MPEDSMIFNLQYFAIEEVKGYKPVKIYAKYIGPRICPHCNSQKLRNKGRFFRVLNHETMGRRRTELHVESCKYKCLACFKYFNLKMLGVKPRFRSTEAFKREVFERHTDGVSLKRLSENAGVSYSTIDRWNQEFLKRLNKEKLAYSFPRILGIDEHFFTHKQGFATTFCDLERHRVYDVVLGRSQQELKPYLGSIEDRRRVKLVCIDLSSGYRSLIKRWFPKARIVADRFHVIKMINHHFLNFWKTYDEENRKRYRLYQAFRKRRKNLSDIQRVTLDQYLTKHPILFNAYRYKEKLCRLMNLKRVNFKQMPRLVRLFLSYIAELKSSPMTTLAKTLESWMEEIALMWRFTRNNGITEGFHTKMEMISRRAFGFRNFENYRLRVKVLCS